MDLRLEEVARAIDLVLRDRLDDAVAEVADEMSVADAVYFAAISETVPDTTLAPIASYQLGHQPLILERPLDQYPTVTVMCFQDTPDESADYDQAEVSVMTAFVELMVVSQDESHVNRLSWRYAKALHRVLTEEKSLGGAVEEIEKAPSVDVSNAMQRRESPGSNAIWFIQGVRIDLSYRLTYPW